MRQIEDSEAVDLLDPFYTDYSSIEEFLFNILGSV